MIQLFKNNRTEQGNMYIVHAIHTVKIVNFLNSVRIYKVSFI